MLRNRYDRRIVKKIRESVRRRGAMTHGEAAVIEFYTLQEAERLPSRALAEPSFQFPPMPKSPRSASEDEDEGARTCSACEREEDDAEAKYCRACGARMSDVEDERRSRADENEDA